MTKKQFILVASVLAFLFVAICVLSVRLVSTLSSKHRETNAEKVEEIEDTKDVEESQELEYVELKPIDDEKNYDSPFGYWIYPYETDKELETYPKNFYETDELINGAMTHAYTDGRFYIFYAEVTRMNPDDIYDFYQNQDWYVLDSYGQLFVRYDQDFMNARGKKKTETREKYHEDLIRDKSDEAEFRAIPVDDEPKKIPDGFKKVHITLEGVEFDGWTNDRYYIFYAKSRDGIVDWYIYDSLEQLYMEYEPSFMAGGY